MRRALFVLVFLSLVLACGRAAAQTTPPTEPQAPVPDATADPFFDDTVLQEIHLTINPRDWKELRDNYLTNRYFPCYFTWNGTTVKNVGIRSRGTGSRSGTKPGLRVDFDYYTDKQRFLNLKSVVLRNQTQDPSMLHESVAMKLYARMGIPTSREAHVKLFVNDEYAGLYTIVEAVDKVFLTRQFQQNDGYLYEYDYDAEDEPWYFDYKGEDPALYSPKPFKPATHEKDPDPKPLERLFYVINRTSDRDFVEQFPEYLDARKFLTYLAAENFVADLDGILGNWAVNNFYFYRFENRNLSTFVPWDKSEAFKDSPEHSIWYNIDVTGSRQNRLMGRLMTFEEYVTFYLDELERAATIAETPVATDPAPGPTATAPRATAMGWLEAEVQRQYKLIRDAALSDPYKPFSNADFEAGVQSMVDYARARSAYVKAAVPRSRGTR